MRLRKKSWAEPELRACPFAVDDPTLYRSQWKKLFGNNHPLHLELGCGKGGFIAQKAAQNTAVNYIAVDIKDAVLGLAKRSIERAFEGRPVNNVKIMSQDIERIGMILTPEDVVDRIYINFCNPWPKPTQKKKRLTHSRQLRSYAAFLRPGGEVWFKTDDDGLFDDSIRCFDECGYRIRWQTRDLAQSGFTENIETEHERMFREQGVPIKFLIAVFEGLPAQPQEVPSNG